MPHAQVSTDRRSGEATRLFPGLPSRTMQGRSGARRNDLRRFLGDPLGLSAEASEAGAEAENLTAPDGIREAGNADDETATLRVFAWLYQRFRNYTGKRSTIARRALPAILSSAASIKSTPSGADGLLQKAPPKRGFLLFGPLRSTQVRFKLSA
jgi:hypothetical protein